MRKKAKTLGYETKHCMWLMQWVRLQAHTTPELKLLFHITNEGKRTRAAGGIAKAMGMTKGVWDFNLPVARAVPHSSPVMKGSRLYYGLWIETKKPGEKLTKEQVWWGEKMFEHGHYTAVCYSWMEARQVLIDYLGINIVKARESQ